MPDSLIKPTTGTTVVQDNLLSLEDFSLLNQTLVSDRFENNFPWYYSPYEENTFQFFNNIWETWLVNSPPQLFNLFIPLLEALNVRSLLRIKCNLNIKDSEHKTIGMHVDYHWDDSLTTVFYLNNNNGGTLFEDGTFIESKSNRSVTFPANTKHSGVTQTDSDKRVIINLNYF